MDPLTPFQQAIVFLQNDPERLSQFLAEEWDRRAQESKKSAA